MYIASTMPNSCSSSARHIDFDHPGMFSNIRITRISCSVRLFRSSPKRTSVSHNIRRAWKTLKPYLLQIASNCAPTSGVTRVWSCTDNRCSCSMLVFSSMIGYCLQIVGGYPSRPRRPWNEEKLYRNRALFDGSTSVVVLCLPIFSDRAGLICKYV